MNAAFYSGHCYWMILAAAAAVLAFMRQSGRRARAAVLSVASTIALLICFDLGRTSIACLVLTVAWVPLGTRITRGLAQSRPTTASLLAFAPVLLAWVFGKHSTASSPLAPLAFVGFSFLLVKAWTFIKDTHDGRIESDTFTVIAYLTYFPTFAMGPMHLYGEFSDAISSHVPPRGGDMVDVVYRVFLGLAKVKVLAPLLQPLSLMPLAGTDWHHAGAGSLILASCVFSTVLVLDFSGYSDLAIASSRLLGISAPENFRAPFAATNIRDFWQRWHISFSRVLTGYVFIPFTRWFQSRVSSNDTLTMVTGYIATFAICGYWHGSRPHFVLWGLYHAVGLVAYDLFRRKVARRRGRAKPSPYHPGRALAWAATFLFVSLGWVLFVLPVGEP